MMRAALLADAYIIGSLVIAFGAVAVSEWLKRRDERKQR